MTRCNKMKSFYVFGDMLISGSLRDLRPALKSLSWPLEIYWSRQWRGYFLESSEDAEMYLHSIPSKDKWINFSGTSWSDEKSLKMRLLQFSELLKENQIKHRIATYRNQWRGPSSYYIHYLWPEPSNRKTTEPAHSANSASLRGR